MVGFAVLGCGRIGRMHARNIKANPRAELIAVYDVVERAARETAAELQAEAVEFGGSCVWPMPGVDAVFVASSTDTHVDLITQGVRAGKAVLCEKPIDLDSAARGNVLGRDRWARSVGDDRLQPPLRPVLQGPA